MGKLFSKHKSTICYRSGVKYALIISFLLIFARCKDKVPEFLFDPTRRQNADIQNYIDRIDFLPYIPDLSGSKDFWELVKRRDLVFCIVQSIADTSATHIPIPNSGGNYLVGDVCLVALENIILCFPTDSILNIIDNEYLGSNKNAVVFLHKNKLLYNSFSILTEKWIMDNMDNLVWLQDFRKFRTSSDWQYDNNEHPAGGYFVLAGIENCEFCQ